MSNRNIIGAVFVVAGTLSLKDYFKGGGINFKRKGFDALNAFYGDEVKRSDRIRLLSLGLFSLISGLVLIFL